MKRYIWNDKTETFVEDSEQARRPSYAELEEARRKLEQAQERPDGRGVYL